MKRSLLAGMLIFLTMAGLNTARAFDVVLDDVDVQVEPEWGVIRVLFTMPTNYERHFPLEHGELLTIFFSITGLDMQNISLRTETRFIAATPAMPEATITFEPPISRNLQRDPWSLSVRFDRDVTYNVRPGDDNRSILIYIPIVPVQNYEAPPTEAIPSAPPSEVVKP